MAPIRPIRDARLGTVLRDTYRLDEVLGRGGTGSVYRALNVRDGSLAAVKVLRADHNLSGTSDTALPSDDHPSDQQRSARRFAREARIVAALQHPSIVKIFAFEAASAPVPGSSAPPAESYLAMELLDGEPLSHLLKRRPLSPAEVLALYGPLCDAIGFAHEKGVVHRDLKPDNVFLVGGRVDDPRVLDFGISKVLQADASQLTTDAILGTPAYMAPELVRNPAQVDHRADIFALGAMLFHSLTGQLPFEGDTMLAVLHKVLMGRAPSMRHFRPELPPELDLVVQRALCRNPQDRYQTTQELLASLAEAARAAPGDPKGPAPTALMPTVDQPPSSAAEAVAQTLMMPIVGPEAERRGGEGQESRSYTGEVRAPAQSGAAALLSTDAPLSAMDLAPAQRRLLPARFWIAALIGSAAGVILALLGLR